MCWGVVGFALTEACRHELNLGITLGKQMIVMAYPMFAPQLQTYLGANVVLIDPLQPGETEFRIVSHLKSMDAQKSTNTSLVALGTLALGLLLFCCQRRTQLATLRDAKAYLHRRYFVSYCS